MKNSLKNTKNNEKTNTTMKPVTIKDLKSFCQEEDDIIMLEAKQVIENKSLFYGYGPHNIFVLEDHRTVEVVINVADKVVCPIDTMRSLLHTATNVCGIKIENMLTDQALNDAKIMMHIHEQVLKMFRAGLIQADIKRFYGQSPSVSKKFEKNHYILDEILQDEDRLEYIIEMAAEKENSYPMNAGSTRFIDTEINNFCLYDLLESACAGLLDRIKKTTIPNRQSDEYESLLTGLIIISHLRGMDQARAFKFIRKSAPFLDREDIEIYYDVLTIKQ